jgi:hypothetical protein
MSVAPTKVLRPVGHAVSVVVAGLVLALIALLPLGAHADASLRRAPSTCTVKLSDKSSVLHAADGANAVIAARLTKAVKTPPPATLNVPRPAHWTYTIRVVHTFRGSAQPGTAVMLTQTPRLRRLGKALSKGTYLFFVHQAGPTFTAKRCGGAALMTHGLTKGLRSQLTADLSTSPGGGVAVQLTAPQGGVRDVPSLNRMIAPGVGLALIGLLGLLLVGRIAREHH